MYETLQVAFVKHYWLHEVYGRNKFIRNEPECLQKCSIHSAPCTVVS